MCLLNCRSCADDTRFETLWLCAKLDHCMYLSHAALCTFSITTCTGCCKSAICMMNFLSEMIYSIYIFYIEIFFFFFLTNYFRTCYPGQNDLNTCPSGFLVCRPAPRSPAGTWLSNHRVQAFRPISSASLPLQCYRQNARGAPKCDQLRTFSSISAIKPP